jgi:DNA topoisomerase-3
LYDALPDIAKFPDMTALWHEQQIEIERGELGVNAFVESLVAHVGSECARVLKDGLGLKFDKFSCPTCNSAMRRRKGEKGYFWGCTQFPSCKTTLPDDNGIPGAKVDMKDRPIASEVHQCPACGKGLARRQGKKGYFWGCSGYPSCKRTFPDNNGKPNYTAMKKEITK